MSQTDIVVETESSLKEQSWTWEGFTKMGARGQWVLPAVISGHLRGFSPEEMKVLHDAK